MVTLRAPAPLAAVTTQALLSKWPGWPCAGLLTMPWPAARGRDRQDAPTPQSQHALRHPVTGRAPPRAAAAAARALLGASSCTPPASAGEARRGARAPRHARERAPDVLLDRVVHDRRPRLRARGGSGERPPQRLGGHAAPPRWPVAHQRGLFVLKTSMGDCGEPSRFQLVCRCNRNTLLQQDACDAPPLGQWHGLQ